MQTIPWFIWLEFYSAHIGVNGYASPNMQQMEFALYWRSKL